MIQDTTIDSMKCPYKRGVQNEVNPHTSTPFVLHKKIYDDALDAVGRTPMIRLNKIPKEYGLKCEVLVKCEFVSMGGSVKDRIGMRMILDAEKQGRIKPGNALVEATSGNTGVGLALAAAVKGYPLYITMPDKMSTEKEDILTGLGAKVIRTPNVASDHPDSLLQQAKRMAANDSNIILLDQYSNPSNPMAHYEGTGAEILWQTDNRVDAVVISAGTGGTITGVGRRVHEKLPNCKIVVVDPYGSDLALPAELNKSDVKAYKIEGIGYDFIPRVFDRSQVDAWVKTHDKESFIMARKLISEEGLLCGGSSGTVVCGAMKWAQKQNFTENDRIVIVLADNIRNYISKHLNKGWMIENGFISYDELKESTHPLAGKPISELNLPDVRPLDIEQATIGECMQLLKDLPAVPLAENGKLVSVVFQKKLMAALVNQSLDKNTLASRIQSKDFVVVPNTLDQNQLERIMERHEIVFIQQENGLSYATPRHILNVL